MDIIQIAGWLGTIIILAAYGLVSFKMISGDSRTYQWLNLTGAALLGYNVFQAQAWPALFLEVVWGGIALVALLRYKSS